MGSRTLKMDFTRGELLTNPPRTAQLKAPYSDYPSDVRISTYTKREILAEKLCALMGRTEVRDLYDMWWLFEFGSIESLLLTNDLVVKAKHKGHDPAQLGAVLDSKESRFASQWETRLSQQVTNLPHFDEVMRAVRRHVRQLLLE
jgi:predicted nucleotidyltransferase component of viral defense system